MTNQPDVTVAVNINSGIIAMAPMGKPNGNIAVSARAAGRAKDFPSPVSDPVAAV